MAFPIFVRMQYVSFEPEEFSSMMFNIGLISRTSSLLKAFPVLKQFDDFTVATSPLDKEKVLRWVMMVYDQNSPVVKKVADWKERKIIAAQQAGFTVDAKGTFEDAVADMLQGKNDIVNRMALCLIRIQSNMEWGYFCAACDNYFNITFPKLQKGELTPGKVKEDMKAIDQARIDLLRGDASDPMKLSLMRVYQESAIDVINKIRPEGRKVRKARKRNLKNVVTTGDIHPQAHPSQEPV